MTRKLIFTYIVIWSCAVSAQNEKIYNLNEITVTAGRFPVKLNELSRSVVIIDSSAIHSLPVNSIQDIFKYIGGVDLRTRGNDGVQADVSIHGGSSEETLIMIDGIRISDPQTGHHNLNIPLSPDGIDRIEVLKGQGSGIFGPNAFSGAINIITKKSHDSYVAASLLGGENGFWESDLNGNYSYGSFSNNISFTKKKSDGYCFNTAFDITNFSISQNIQAGDNKINLLYGFLDKQFGANSFYSSLFLNQWEHTKTNLLDASADFIFSNISITPKIYWRKNNDDFFLDHNRADWNQNINETNSFGAEIQGTITSPLGKTSIGGEISGNDISGGLGDHRRNEKGIFGEHSFSLLKNINVSVGGFAYNYSGIGWKIWPDAEASYNFSKEIRIYSSFGKAFRLPTYTDLYSTSPANQGNPNLLYEEVNNYEIGFIYTKDFFQTNVSLFLKDGNNLIDWVRKSSNDPWIAQNVLGVRTTGAETNLILYPQQIVYNFPIMEMNINYTYLTANRNAVNYQSKYLLDHLRHQFIIGLTNEFILGILQNWNLRYEERVNYEPHFILDMKFSKRIDQFEISFGATNLLNKSYADISGVNLPGRWLNAGIKYSVNNL